MSDSPSAEQRTKRRRIDKHGRFAALERLKKVKEGGAKNKYEVDDIKNVYDEVDEAEYAKIVNRRANDDFLDDDDGFGYVENGREIFDEDELDPEASAGKGRNSAAKDKGGRKGKKRNRNDGANAENGPVTGRKSLKNFFTRESDTKVKVDADDALADILGEISSVNVPGGGTSDGSGTTAKKEIRPLHSVAQTTPKPRELTAEEEMKRYMENFSRNIKKPEKPAVPEHDSDDEMLKNVLEAERKPPAKKKAPTPVKAPSVKAEDVPRPTPVVVPVKEEITDETDLSQLHDGGFLDDDFEMPPEVTVDKKKADVKQEIPSESEKNLLNGWESIIAGLDTEMMNEMVAGSGDDSAMQQTSPENSETMKFWFWDAWSDPNKCQGELYLFGRMASGKGEYKSVCVHVQNVDRCMYLLARELELNTEKPVSMLDVYNEFCDDISSKLNILKYRTKVVTKNFAYTSGMKTLSVPAMSEYLEVRYSAKQPAPSLERKYKTIAHIFGTNTNVVEQFLLERKVKGPCWMEVKNFTHRENRTSWCKMEIVVPDLSCVSVVAEVGTVVPPPLVLCSINVRSTLNRGANEITMLTLLVNDNFALNKPPPTPPFTRQYCGVTRPSNTAWPMNFNPGNCKAKVIKCETERALLTWFLSTVHDIDPDLVVTFDSYDFQLDLICQRLMTTKMPLWNRIGRLKMKFPASRRVDDFFVGRMICDVKTSAEELIRSRSYDLNTLCMEVLKIGEGERKDVLLDDIPTMYERADSLVQLVGLTMQDNFFTLRLMCELNALPLALQITQIAGNLMNRTLHGGRAERNEFLLLHAFREKDYILPDKALIGRAAGEKDGETEKRKPKSKAAYAGGLVLDPIKGFYDKFVLLMDFNSLYPSIIQEYNICFTTVLPPPAAGEDGGEQEVEPTILATDEPGILPRQIRKLVESRKAVKQLMKAPGLEPEQMMQYNIRQMALKLTANSLYGCLGYTRSRFYAQHLASLITLKGREILMNTKSIVEKMNYQVIYGDTDSIMVNTNITDYEQVFRIGGNIKQIVNKTYKCLELDVDGIYKYLLLLKKKKYAAVTIAKKGDEFVCNQELKGLDIVRRDWSRIAVMAGNIILKQILSDLPMDERIENVHLRLEKLKDDLVAGSLSLQLLEITKQLTRPLSEYSDAGQLPHVQVAMRMNKLRNRNFKRGDMVNYIICKDGTTAAAMKRAYHIDELRDPVNKEKLSIDIEYYLSQQIYPVVFRICEPLEGTDACRLAICLGLDPKKFQSLNALRDGEREHGDGEAILKSITQKYRLCHRFEFTCPACKTKNLVAMGFRKESGRYRSVFEKCSNDSCSVLPTQYLPAILNELTLAIRADIKRFYERWMVCDNPVCNQNTRLYSQVAIKNNPLCLHCRKGLLVLQYSESDLYQQLNYYGFMFDLTNYDTKTIKALSADIRNMYTVLKGTVDRFLLKSKYATVQLSTLYLNYALNPSSRQSKIYPVKELAALVEAKDPLPEEQRKPLTDQPKAATIQWSLYLK